MSVRRGDVRKTGLLILGGILGAALLAELIVQFLFANAL